MTTKTDNQAADTKQASKPKATYSIIGGGVNSSGWWVYSVRNNSNGRVVGKSKSAVAQLRREGRIN